MHAFTEMGLEAQLLFFLGFYIVLSLGLLIWRWRKHPGTGARGGDQQSGILDVHR